ncbi:MAG: aminopeptidase [Oscillospiraceae bacterium]|nr:aminopeptidase [Oscillospiraceae bacterium]
MNANELTNALFYQPKHGYDRIDADEQAVMNAYCEAYKYYLNTARTERECVKLSVEMAEAAGFVKYEVGMPLPPGTKLYRNIRGKSLALAVIGQEGLQHGCLMAGAHIDSPRLDLKQNPLMETENLAYFRTHYYGGIRKYQWVATPLELHGVVALKNGDLVNVVIGRDPADPQFVITDLLPHLAADQSKKGLHEAHTGEGLKVFVGSVPYACEGPNRVKLAVMSLLNSRYGITEEDFLSAELEVVPACEVRDIGLDRSMIGGYGHDDRSCAFAELQAILDLDVIPHRTAICILTDKEETGSMGVTGILSRVFDHFMEDLCEAQGVSLHTCYANSFCISADVCNGYDPLYPEVSDIQNNAKMNHGVAMCKYTGSRGKSGTSDASAETVATLRRVFDNYGVVWQMTEMGKVDQGGGGTIAQYMANRNIETIDAGVPVMSMHAPFELVSKFDCYMTYKAVCALYHAK